MPNQKVMVSFPAILLPILLYSIFRFSIGPLLPSFQAAYAISYAEAGSIVSLSIVMVGVGTGISAIFAQRLGDRNTALLGLILFAIPMTFLALLSNNYYLFTLLFIFSGLGCGLMTTPTYSIAATLFPRQKGTAIGFVSATYNIGGFIGPVLTGFLVSYLSWRLPLATIGVLGFVFAAFFFAALRGFKSKPAKTERRTVRKELLGNRYFALVMISMMLGDFAFLSFITWTPDFVLRILPYQMSQVAVDSYFGIAVGLGGAGIIVAGFLFDRIGGKRSASIGGACTTAAVVGLFLSNSLLPVLAFMFLAGFFSNWFWGLLSAMAQSHVGTDRKTDAVAFAQTAAFVGAFSGPAFVGLLNSSLTIGDSLLLVVSLPYAIFTFLMLFLYDDPPVRMLH